MISLIYKYISPVKPGFSFISLVSAFYFFKKNGGGKESCALLFYLFRGSSGINASSGMDTGQECRLPL
jgi:hypothetical protein